MGEGAAGPWRSGAFPRLVQLVGPSGSGKSRYAAGFAGADAVMSLDALREERGDRADQGANSAILARGLDRLRAALGDGGTVLWDATSLTVRQRAPVLGAAARYGALTTQVVLLVDEGELAARDARRAHPVPVAVRAAHLSRFAPPLPGNDPVTGTAVGAENDPVTVFTPSAPVRSCTGQVDLAIRELLTAELYRAWETLEAGADPAVLLATPPLHRRHAGWAVVTVSAVDGEDFAVTRGRFRGRVRALVQALEDSVSHVHAWPRPSSTRPHRTRYGVGLGPAPPDADRLAALAHHWARGLPGVAATWADGGSMPTPR